MTATLATIRPATPHEAGAFLMARADHLARVTARAVNLGNLEDAKRHAAMYMSTHDAAMEWLTLGNLPRDVVRLRLERMGSEPTDATFIDGHRWTRAQLEQVPL